MRIKDITRALEQWAPRVLQEDYDNSGMQVGNPDAEVHKALISLDCTEEVVTEAVKHGCGLVISHHPVIFRGLKSLTGATSVERTLLAAIRNNVAIYALHTNLDNVLTGVNGEIAQRLGLAHLQVLAPKPDQLHKLVVFVPLEHMEHVRDAMFRAGAGSIGAYDECSFISQGTGTFRPGLGSNPYKGEEGMLHSELEAKVEVVIGAGQAHAVVQAMLTAHPYEVPAYDLLKLANPSGTIGSGAIGQLPEALGEEAFIALVKERFGAPVVRHTALQGKPVQRVAVCGGSGAFLIGKAMAAGADAFLTSDVKYHQFFEAENKLLIADIGHFESEQWTMHLIQRRLGEVLPTFATRLTETVTNPIHCS